MRMRSAGRGRLPVCVVRNPSVLRCIAGRIVSAAAVAGKAKFSETAALQRQQRIPEPRIVRTQADGFLTRSLRFIPPSLSSERLAEARIGLRVIRLQTDGFSIRHLAIGMLALLLERRPEIEPALAVLRPQA